MNDHMSVLDRMIKDMEPLSYEELYHRLGRLRAEMPHPSKLDQPEWR